MKHGTRHMYSGGGCRCDDCRRANAEAVRRWRRSRGSKPRMVARHGTHSKYTLGCRCVDCRQANTDWQRQRRRAGAADLAAGLVTVEHGLVSTYNNWLCRCDPCTAAHSKACREYALRRRAVS